MRISQLRIRNFRSIENLELEVPQVCALVGPNNSGKSNILLAVQKVLGRDWVNTNTFDQDDIFSRNENNDVRIELNFDPSIPYRRFKNADPVQIGQLQFEYNRYKIGDQKGQRRLEQKCLQSNGKPIFVLKRAPNKEAHRTYEKPEFELLVGIPPEVRASVPVIYIGTGRSLKEHLPNARYSLLGPLFEDINRNLHDPANTVALARDDGTEEQVQRAVRFQKMLNEAVQLLRTDDFQNLERSIKRHALDLLGFDPDADADRLDFFFSPFDTMDFYHSLDLLAKEGDFTISATQLGEGIQNALVLSILRAFEERHKQGAVLLIEEPEMFLHPQMQRSLYKTLRKIGETNQVIYTTHSPHFVAVPDYHQIGMVRKVGAGTVVTMSVLETNEKRREKLIKELDPERNELFFATRLLLVEGDTEKLALPEYSKRLPQDLDKLGATIVEVGGKRNLMEFARISSSFGIPTGVLYDEDSSDFRDNRDEEREYNAQLDALASNENTSVWRLSRNYEDELRRTVGEGQFQQLCQKYPQMGKPTRARLIASEADLPIPPIIETVLKWLANQ
jgi:putative ATP-dependent endonuclease of the OLD family